MEVEQAAGLGGGEGMRSRPFSSFTKAGGAYVLGGANRCPQASGPLLKALHSESRQAADHAYRLLGQARRAEDQLWSSIKQTYRARDSSGTHGISGPSTPKPPTR